MFRKLNLIIAVPAFSFLVLNGAAHVRFDTERTSRELMDAVMSQDLEEAEACLMADAKITDIFDNGNILHAAVKYKNIVILKKIFELSDKRSLETALQTEWKEFTPFDLAIYYAAQDGNIKRVQFLIDHGAHVNGYTTCKCTPLHNAMIAFGMAGDENFSTHYKIVQLLLSKDALVKTKDAKGHTILVLAAQIGKNTEYDKSYSPANRNRIVDLLHVKYLTEVEPPAEATLPTMETQVDRIKSIKTDPAILKRFKSTIKIQPSVRNLQTNTIRAEDNVNVTAATSETPDTFSFKIPSTVASQSDQLPSSLTPSSLEIDQRGQMTHAEILGRINRVESRQRSSLGFDAQPMNAITSAQTINSVDSPATKRLPAETDLSQSGNTQLLSQTDTVNITSKLNNGSIPTQITPNKSIASRLFITLLGGSALTLFFYKIYERYYKDKQKQQTKSNNTLADKKTA